MLLLGYPPEPYIPRIMPLIWADRSASDPPKLQIDACLEVARRLRPCFGPRGLPKSLAFRFLHGLSAPPVHTPDTASVLQQMELEDPAARSLMSAAIAQAQEVGDGAGLVLLLAASLLEQAQKLLALGLTQEEVEEGYRLACGRALELLDGGEGLVQATLEDSREERQVSGVFRVLLSTRVPEMADMLAEAVARCCVQSWTRDEQGEMTFDSDAIQIIKTMTEQPPNQNGPREESEEANKGEDMDEKKEVITAARQREEGETEEGKYKVETNAEEEGDWVACDSDDKEDKPDRDHVNGAVGAYAPPRAQGREQQLIHQLLSDYVGQTHTEKVRSIRRDESYERNYREVEPDEDWEILGLALEEIRLEGEEGADGGEGLARWQTEEESRMAEKLQAQGDGRSRRRRGMMRWAGGLRGLRGSTAACKRLFRSLVRLSRKCLAQRGRVQARGPGQVRGVLGFQNRGRVRKLHRPMGKVRDPGSVSGKRRHPRKNVHVSKEDSQPAKPLQASLASQEASDQQSQQSVTITLHSPDRELMDRCEAAIRACLQLYGTMQSDPRLVLGAGAMEAVLSAQLCQYGLTLPGLEQMAVHSFAQALLAPVRVLGENQGTPADMAVTRLHEGLRQRSKSTQGPHKRPDKEESDLLEPLRCKCSALKKATTAVLSVMADPRIKSPGERGAKTKSPEFSTVPEPGHQCVQQS